MMTALFGANQVAKLFLPKGSASWKIDGVVKKDQYDNTFLLSFSLSDQELVDVRRCFDETTHIFAFGRNPSKCALQVSILMFLYNGCPKSHGNWATIDDIRKAYADKRVYKNPQPLSVTIDGFTCSGFLVDMSIDNVNPSDKTSVLTFTFLLDQEV